MKAAVLEAVGPLPAFRDDSATMPGVGQGEIVVDPRIASDVNPEPQVVAEAVDGAPGIVFECIGTPDPIEGGR